MSLIYPGDMEALDDEQLSEWIRFNITDKEVKPNE